MTLRDGTWEGAPYAGGGAARPSVSLVPDFLVPWNADGEGPPESVVLLGENSGGSGEYIYLCLAGRVGERVENLATILLGDRVQIVSADTSGRRLRMTLLQAGPEGALCCPDEIVVREWEFRDGTLRETVSGSAPRPLSPDIMAGTTWRLTHWDYDVPAADTPAITLSFSAGRFSGNSGCNSWFANVAAGEMPGDIVPGPIGTTRMACPDPAVGETERRFLQLLGSVVKFGFTGGRLMLMYEGESGTGVLLFRRTQGSPRT